MPPSRTTPEALQALRERLHATQEAAARLADDAAREWTSEHPPPAGWDVPRSASDAGEELDALVTLIAGLRDVLPPELRAQLAELVKSILLFVRAVLDWWIERVDDGATGGTGTAGRDDVEDIPIA